MTTYKIVRNYFKGMHGDGERPFHRTIKTGLTLEQAQEHCQNPETSSRTCTSAKAKAITRKHGPWFDGYNQE